MKIDLEEEENAFILDLCRNDDDRGDGRYGVIEGG